MIDIDELERLAKAALSRGEEDCVDLKDWFSQEEFMSNMLLHPVDARFAEGCSPAAILSLTAEVRRLRNLLDNRPAVNAALVAEFMKWTAVVYDSDIASVRAAHPKEGV